MPRSTPRSGAPRPRDGIDVTTLAITAVASAAAAYACSKLWAPGALPSAAAMPVLVALIREGLQRPTEAVTRAVPVRGMVRGAGSPDEHGSDPEPEPSTRVAQPGVIGDPPNRRDRRWRLAVITGLLGFVVCVVAFTATELVAGGSVADKDSGTTLFGGDKKAKRERAPTTTTPGTTVTTPATTVTAPSTAPTTTTPPPGQTVPVPTRTAPSATTNAPAPGEP